MVHSCYGLCNQFVEGSATPRSRRPATSTPTGTLTKWPPRMADVLTEDDKTAIRNRSSVSRRKTAHLQRKRGINGDGGNRTHVRGRVKDGVYERSRRSDLIPR